ncbi:2-oxo-4-hydroxy-4-carboxy-5-ureidoimidazoline decarboxylase ASCRUDRAFT_78142 [Ascoidea rubescens DSM 1968]|uniref:Oxo-4-hydroxy-4-carboxy-5-ureidoimidazoline decarboxylase domain-containing protein n=1 Tax=Ascoidea rubescens DSM 1968 TaxID=1344418 RepID=A0A1D2V999_9ASCO|nr:hypothetical protein ASCRUDRAFT_78142 [Ascoidea rubescens DSM 1968]ODV58241.1 hypothetical protein ASCRUDRAFT_78142 [Ascoidea rubescens DSM 1968]
MSAYTLPPISSISGLSNNSKIELLNHLFEPCEVLQKILLTNVLGSENAKFYSTYKQFIEVSRKELLEYLKLEKSSPQYDENISKIISAHPRLGANKSKIGNLSIHSQKEQQSLLQASREESEKLSDLNNLYESKFPGLRYVVFVNGRSREVIMANMVERIRRNNIGLEKVDSINAMCDIALDRAKKLGAKL